MNWKKIAVLFLVLILLIVVIYFVSRHEQAKKAVEGQLYTMTAAEVERLEVQNGPRLFAFERRAEGWWMTQPQNAKADKMVLDALVDEFATVKYDREVDKNCRNPQKYGLDRPALQLRLFRKGGAQPVRMLEFGLKNDMDGSSYVRLAGSTAVVMLPAFKRTQLEKEVFDFRDKKILVLDSAAVAAITYSRGDATFSLARKENRWWLEQPLSSLAAETKVSDMLFKLSNLDAKGFYSANTPEKRQELGFDKPLVAVTVKANDTEYTLALVLKDEKCYAVVPSFDQICEVEKELADKFPAAAVDLREHKLGSFFTYEVKEMQYRAPGIEFAARKSKEGLWEPVGAAAGKKAADERINQMLSAVEDNAAVDFIDKPAGKTVFTHFLTLKSDDPQIPGKTKTVELQFALVGENVVARNPLVPYLFKVAKDLFNAFPKKVDELLAPPAAPAAAGKPAQ